MRYILLALLLVGCGRKAGTYYLEYLSNGKATCEKVESGLSFNTTVFRGPYAEGKMFKSAA